MSKHRHKDSEDIDETLEERTEEPIEEAKEEKESDTIPVKKEEWERLRSSLARINAEHYELQKDFDNQRVRALEAIRQARVDGLKDALMTIFPALDHFKKAKSMVQDKNALKGIDMIEKSLLSSLDDLKVHKIASIGEQFDPALHNAVLMQESDKPSGTIIEELESGYMYDDKVLKYSQVVVAK